jgi:hypothetical protein
MTSRAHGPSPPEGFLIRLQRRDEATKIVCIALLLAIAMLALRVVDVL